MSGQPDAAQYEELVEKLSEIERRASSSELDSLTASFQALSAVLDFLYSDARIRERQAARPLFRLMLALHDRQQGSKPKLFFDPPERKGAKGAPSYTSAIILRAYVVVAFLSLREGGMSKEEAGSWLAAELERSGIKQPNGKAIKASAITRWGAELGGKSLQGSDQVFAMVLHGTRRKLLEKLEQKQPLSEASIDRRGAQLAAQVFIKQLRLGGF